MKTLVGSILKKSIFCVAMSAFLVACQSTQSLPQPQGLQLTLEVETHHANLPTLKKERLLVEIGSNHLFVTKPDNKKVLFDFVHRKVVEIARDQPPVWQSLISYLGPRTGVVGNNKHIRTIVLRATNDGNDVDDTQQLATLLTENDLSLTINDHYHSKIRQEERSGELHHYAGKQLLIATSDQQQSIPPRFVPHYYRFLRLWFGGHPAVINRLKDQNTVPTEIRLNLGLVNTRLAAVRVQAWEQISVFERSEAYTENSLVPVYDDAEFSEIAKKLPADTAIARTEAAKSVFAEAELFY